MASQPRKAHRFGRVVPMTGVRARHNDEADA